MGLTDRAEHPGLDGLGIGIPDSGPAAKGVASLMRTFGDDGFRQRVLTIFLPIANVCVVLMTILLLIGLYRGSFTKKKKTEEEAAAEAKAARKEAKREAKKGGKSSAKSAVAKALVKTTALMQSSGIIISHGRLYVTVDLLSLSCPIETPTVQREGGCSRLTAPPCCQASTRCSAATSTSPISHSPGPLDWRSRSTTLSFLAAVKRQWNVDLPLPFRCLSLTSRCLFAAFP